MISKSVSIIEPDPNYGMVLRNLFTRVSYFPYLIKGIHSDLENLRALKFENPDIVLTEISFTDRLLEHVIAEIKKTVPDSEIIVLSSIVNRDIIIRALKAGADGYIIKTLNCNTIMNTLYEYSEGGVPLSRIASKAVVESFRKNNKSVLTRREGEIMDLISKCKSYIEISNELNIGKDTTKKHIRNIYKKLSVHKKSEAILIAKREKFIV